MKKKEKIGGLERECCFIFVLFCFIFSFVFFLFFVVFSFSLLFCCFCLILFCFLFCFFVIVYLVCFFFWALLFLIIFLIYLCSRLDNPLPRARELLWLALLVPTPSIFFLKL